MWILGLILTCIYFYRFRTLTLTPKTPIALLFIGGSNHYVCLSSAAVLAVGTLRCGSAGERLMWGPRPCCLLPSERSVTLRAHTSAQWQAGCSAAQAWLPGHVAAPPCHEPQRLFKLFTEACPQAPLGPWQEDNDLGNRRPFMDSAILC